MASRYQIDTVSGAHVRAGYRPPHEFSDESGSEGSVREAILHATDRSSTSRELDSAIRDWPSFCHLSSRRCNLLRPIRGLLSGRILEIGCGCGALTRYLGECGASVSALDASFERASIAVLRCQGLPNVRVFVDTLQEFEPEAQFNVVLCVGVLEYSPLYFPGPDPVASALRRTAELLEEDGALIIGIENQLGLRYLAGWVEGHVGIFSCGIQDLYRDTDPITLGKRCLERKLRQAGFQSIEFLFPFPDYRAPAVVIAARALEDGRLDLGSLLRGVAALPVRPGDAAPAFLERNVWAVLARHGLAADLADSFLILASRKKRGTDAFAVPGLAYIYSTNRLPRFAKETVILERDGRLMVRSAQLYPVPEQPPASSRYEHRLQEEPFRPGRTFDARLLEILGRTGWSLADLRDWAEPWISFLRGQSLAEEPAERHRFGTLPRDYVDGTPFNMVIDEGNRLVAFDLEYVSREPLPLEFVLFRGLWASIFRAGRCAPPAPGVNASLLALVKDMLEGAGVALTDAELAGLVRREAELQEEITGAPVEQTERLIRESTLCTEPSFGAAAAETSHGEPASRCQVFWRSAEADYQESDSASWQAPVNERPQSARLQIAPQTGAPVSLRLDPADRPGMLADLHVSLLDASGDPIWSLDDVDDPAEIAPLREMMFLDLPPGSRGAAAVLTGPDPSFELKLSPAQSRRLSAGGWLECQYRWVTSAEELRELSRVAVSARESPRLHAELERLAGGAAETERCLAETRHALAERDQELQLTRQQLQSVLNSRTWRLASACHRMLARLRALVGWS